MDTTAPVEGVRPISDLRVEVRAPLQLLLDRLRDDLGDELLSLVVIGSSLTDDFHPKHSDINTLMVVHHRSQELLRLLADYGKSLGRKGLRAPLLMTQEYLDQSSDVFGVEFLDFQQTHALVHGTDFLKPLTFHKNDVRLQCERQLKAALIKLRQGYIRVMGRPKAVSELMIEAVSELAVLLRAMLWMDDTDRPREAIASLEAAGRAFEFDPKPIIPLMQSKRLHKLPDRCEAEPLFESLYTVIDHLALRVDKIGDSQ